MEEAPLDNTLTKFIANVGYGGVRGGVLLVNTLVLTPILIFGLGTERFAILALVTPFLRYGFNGVFDLGLATALVRFVSRDFATGDHDSVNEYFASALLMYIFGGTTLLLLFRPMSSFVVGSILRLDSSLYATATTALWQLLGTYVLLLLSNPFFALLMGVQKVHLSHVVGTVALLMELIGVLGLVPFGITISRVVLVYAVGSVVSAVLCVVLVRRHFQALDFGIMSVTRRRLFDLAHYTAGWSVTVSTSMLAPVIDKLILARFVGLSFVAIYEAASKLVEILKRTTQLLLLPLFPLAGAAVQSQTEVQAQVFYRRVFGVNLALSAGLYLIPATLSFGIMRVWLGSELGVPAGWAFVVLLTTGFVLAVVGPAVSILAGTGRMRLLVTTGLVALSLNVVLSSALAIDFGFWGLLAGTAFAYGGQGALILTSLQHQKEFALDVRSAIRMGCVAGGSAVIPALAVVMVFGRVHSVAKLAALGIICISLYCLGLLTFEENRRLFVSVTKHAKKMFAASFRAKRTRQMSHA